MVKTLSKQQTSKKTTTKKVVKKVINKEIIKEKINISKKIKEIPDGDDIICILDGREIDFRLKGVYAYEIIRAYAYQLEKGNEKKIIEHLRKGILGKKLLEKFIMDKIKEGKKIEIEIIYRRNKKFISNIYIDGILYNEKIQEILKKKGLSGGYKKGR